MIVNDEMIDTLSFINKHWRNYANADEKGYMNFFWWFFGILNDSERYEYLDHISRMMNYD